ncbi:D-alanyl-D-alanine carboxypeptidase family protein [Symbiobacterium thermophilum]|uniref:serine-type D-Ala-D-Ala carboxypeptidase n=1 Tax=Symbiobacterium thermophilum TaxID=2734 RepID=A0A953LHH7_SYMTR|nr:D-alanyl-D-alanine carboxypeptidase family protein [Symbiobacterium thermophilum]MBY6277283.1 D-alanyl-D-alanine carboxypeptidase [Symbiobacterium thermophilum]
MNCVRRAIAGMIAALLLISGAEAAAAPRPLVDHYRDVVESPPSLWAHGAILMDAATGDVLWERNAHVRLHPASTTKVLTALIALERGDLDARVTVSKRAAQTPGSSMYLREGEVHTLHDLVHGLLMLSGNDAAVAIAEHIAGSVEAFADLMNERAERLGAHNSHFVNPHGLTHPEHLSTAYDLAVITRAALQNPLFAEIVATPQKELTYEELGRKVVLYNTNRLLRGGLPGADGVKTGTTGAAGPCLIASATRDDQKLIAVVLNASNRWRESAALLEWGFRNFALARLGRAGEVLVHLPVRGGKRRAVPVALREELAVVVPRKTGAVPEVQVDLKRPLRAPLRAGEVVGRAWVPLPGDGRRRVDLIAAEPLPAATWVDRVYQGLVALVDLEGQLNLNLITR